MALIKFTNFGRSTLAIGAASGATSLTLASGTGVKFPTLTGGEYFYLTLENASLVREIVKVTARASDVLTVVRGQDGTTAQTWNAGDVAALRFNSQAILDALFNTALITGATGTVAIPAGTTGERSTALGVGVRYNTTLASFEGYNGTTWGSIGGGATGGGTDQIFWKNGQTVTADHTIASTENAGTFGPVTIANGITVTVSNGSVWSIV